VKSLAEAGSVHSLQDAGMARKAAAPMAPKASTRIEPEFNSLADLNPGLRDAAQAPPEIMQRVLNLAARIEMDAQRAKVAAPAQTAEAGTRQQDLGTMHWPVEGETTSGFGWRTDTVTGAREWHAGLDIAGAEGDAVQSCWDGKVIFSGQRGRFGNLVVIEHPDGWRSYYGHNRVNLVSEGDTVGAGSKIAELGATGRASEPHLHFEIRQGDRAENPGNVMERLQAGVIGTSGNGVE